MKRIFALLSAVLLLAALSGCRSAAPVPAEPPAPAAPVEQPASADPAPAAPAEPLSPASSVAPAEPIPIDWTIEHTDLSEGYPIDMYFEIPVFTGDSDAIDRINADLASVRQSYIDTSAPIVWETVAGMEEYGELSEGERYLDAHRAAVRTCTDELISVTIDYEWWMGGVLDYGVTTYTYDAETGERLTLRDLMGGTDDEIKEAVVAALVEQFPGVEDEGIMDTPMDVIRGMDVGNISFYVEDGVIHAAFSKYEIAYGAAGAFDVVLSEASLLRG